jgi:hypothetical protein
MEEYNVFHGGIFAVLLQSYQQLRQMVTVIQRDINICITRTSDVGRCYVFARPIVYKYQIIY